MTDRFELPKLRYSYDALEPHIDARTMEIHHTKHHAGYTKNFNTALEGIDTGDKTAEEILMTLDSLPENIRAAVRNNGGGYVNHTMFWEIMSPDGGGMPKERLLEHIRRDFGSFSHREAASNATAPSRAKIACFFR